MIINIRHTGIVVANMDESKRFYRDLLGFTIQKQMLETGEYISAVLHAAGTEVKTVKMSAPDGQLIALLEFVSSKNKPRPRAIHDVGISHVAFTVRNLDEEHKRLQNAGISFLSAPQASPDGYAKVVFCRAPERTYVELVEVLGRHP